MNRLAVLLPLLVLAGCPDSSSSRSSSSAPVDPAEQRAAQVDLETRLAEGGDAVQAEAPAADTKTEAAKKLPDMRYYAFDG